MIALCRRPPAGKVTQQGAALIVTALLMLVISLLALAVLTRSNLDERMVFNHRDRQVALQAAEAALREGEEKIYNKFNLTLDESFFIGKDDCRAGNYDGWCYPTSDLQGWTGLSWANGNPPNTVALTSTMVGVSSSPRYLIEYLGADPVGTLGLCTAKFRVTARAVGLNTRSIVTLQTLYSIRPGVCQLLV